MKAARLSEDGAADRRAAPTLYTYDPLDPVPTLGGSNLLTNVGPYDQQSGGSPR